MPNDKVLVTGGNGFFGTYLCRELITQGYNVVSTYHKNPSKCIVGDVDYICFNLTCYDDTEALLRYIQPKYIIHAAGFNGGIKFNLERPYDIFMENTLMALNLFDAAVKYKPDKLISLVTSCAYDCGYSFLHPEQIMTGVPHESVACHGYAKRNLQLLTGFSKKQHKLNAATACCTTLYGPGDCLDLNRTKVMMALIKKFCDAVKNKEETVQIWGDGEAHRQFIFVKDAAKAVILGMKSYNNSGEPMGIAPNGDVSIRELVEKISDLTGFGGSIIYGDESQNGQHKKELIPSKLLDNFEFTELDAGIKETINWYQNLAS